MFQLSKVQPRASARSRAALRVVSPLFSLPLIDAGEEGGHGEGVFLFSQVGESFLESFGSEFLFGELESERDQDRAGRRVGSATERNDEATTVAFAQIVKEPRVTARVNSSSLPRGSGRSMWVGK